MTPEQRYRNLPSVDELASSIEGFPHSVVVEECRRVLEEARRRIGAGEPAGAAPAAQVRQRLERLKRPSLRRVINATGVILHTNLGRAPLAEWGAAEGYSNLEYDVGRGRRGRRDSHTEELLERLLGARAIAVNNGAAAVFLALNELAAGGEAVISRGEMVEIGDGFRIPDICARTGATLVEVGTTNRTRIEDYRRAVTDRTRLLVAVHPSNFKVTGFAGRPSREELAGLGRELGIPVYEDLGSGCLVDLQAYGVDEPTIAASLKAGVDLVSFSGDKLLGGPQAGILAGRTELVERLRANPLYRALRLDKLVIGALETTLRLLWLQRYDDVPVLGMIRRSADEIRVRAEALASGIRGAEVCAGESLLGGGSTPQQTLPTWLVALPGRASELERKLRQAEPPVIGRIEADRLLLDLRTVAPQDDLALRALLAGLV